MKGTIIYIGNFLAPLGDAVAKRAVGLGYSFIDAGFNFKMIGESTDVRRGHISTNYMFNGIEYCNVHRSINSFEHYDYIKDLKNIKKKMLEWSKNVDIAGVILCGTKCSLMANSIVSFCKNMHFPIYSDSMDWLKSHTGNLIFDYVKNADISFELKHVNRRVDGIICISSYLSNYYSSHGCKTIIIPPISPYNKNPANNVNPIVKFVYAGVPCRLDRPLINPEDAKDRLDILIEIFYQLFKAGKEFIFDIFGLTEDQYIIAFPRHIDLIVDLVNSNKVFFHGRVNEDIVKSAVIGSDFTVLLRNKNVTTQAGFSTKISESIALGTPVITNDTSDILEYITDGYDSVIVNIDNRTEMVNKFSQIMNDVSVINKLRTNALKNTSFSPKTYSSTLERFILDVNNEICY